MMPVPMGLMVYLGREKGLWRNPDLSCDSVIFFGNYEGDPLSPPEGEATRRGASL